MAELRRLSEHCDYGDKLEEMLRDRLVCGIANKRYQQRLLGEVDLTFDKAFKMAQAMELAERDSQQLKPAEITPIQKIDNQRYTRHTGQKVATSQNTCHRCGCIEVIHHGIVVFGQFFVMPVAGRAISARFVIAK